MRHLIIAIDGPVGSGKSTVARRVAELLGYTYLDSGAMYRALAWKALERGVPLDDAERLETLATETRIDLKAERDGVHVRVDGADVTHAIRTPEISEATSRISVIPGLRRRMVAEQQRAGRKGSVVMEGRDIGTVVFPRADLKIYLDANVEVRAERRLRELQTRGQSVTPDQMLEDVRDRDRRDKGREASPLVRAPDAVLVDNTAMDVEETARLIVLLARQQEVEKQRGKEAGRKKKKKKDSPRRPQRPRRKAGSKKSRGRKRKRK
ncbi:MAG TPA: (d)CMP kinase [Candidatus Acidoferrales bacterium]|nr:(d)CMP kinase [Candidatus Acidoferrales bacterium]